MAQGKIAGFTLGPASGDGDARGAVGLHSQDISTGTGVAMELKAHLSFSDQKEFRDACIGNVSRDRFVFHGTVLLAGLPAAI